MCANIFLLVGLLDFPYLISNSVMTLYKPTPFKLGTEIVFNWIRGWYHRIAYYLPICTAYIALFHLLHHSTHSLHIYVLYSTLIYMNCTFHSQTTYQWVFLQQNHQNFSPVQQSRNPTTAFYRSHTNKVFKNSLFTCACINHFLLLKFIIKHKNWVVHPSVYFRHKKVILYHGA